MSTRPIGDITTVLDLASRNGQDDYFFPITSPKSWFHREPGHTIYPATMASQEFVHKGTAAWGGRLTFELGALQTGDLLQAISVQIRLSHWYPPNIVSGLQTGAYLVDPSSNPWTYINCLGTSIIEYAEFEVGDQTLERIDGEFIRAYSTLIPDSNMIYGIAADGYGISSPVHVTDNTNSMNPNRPFPTQDGVYFCLLPFSFMRTRFKGMFPLVACAEGSVRVHVQLRPFTDCVRSTLGYRQSCVDSPLGLTTTIRPTTLTDPSFNIVNAAYTPPFLDFRILTYTALVSEAVRKAYIHKPFEQMVKFMTRYHFDEPYRFLVSKTNFSSDTIEVSLPLELNHPCQEIFWVFRRKAVTLNNEWANFAPLVETQRNLISVPKEWLVYATLRVNGSVVEQAPGNWWRQSAANAHKGGWNAWASYVYGLSFALSPDAHQPSGSVNMSRSSSIRLDLKVNVPQAVAVPPGFDADVGQGWEVFVYAIHMNWLRFENGICQKLFED